MPTYSYACSACGHRFDEVQSIHDDALTTCPACDGQIRRVISAVGVTFKGSGFYRTDSRASAKHSSSSSAKPKSESKPAPAPKPATSAAADPA
ncbi:FmdB family transcriptional regulator [Demequina sp. TTPB684]|uniref:FmdB family zinc ribbon protein n=1 Tax=unclassified Demequina TaxID=2620311 RepID=UPI001CF2C3B2|nr:MULTISPECIES: FmdB family zinc ribbon protein [unclassified Demequina]MCB2412428.1 FmdB family transcriptional regulator [Demequina sp. TTPB684]UPU87416.1 FmdB family transcriptional regulator [Demequina sp. TMPB413]